MNPYVASDVHSVDFRWMCNDCCVKSSHGLLERGIARKRESALCYAGMLVRSPFDPRAASRGIPDILVRR